jgi:hypothetical protein
VKNPVSESDIPDTTRSVDDPMDPAEQARVHAALGDLTFLRPDARTPVESMPEEVWTRLSAVIAQESMARATPTARHSRALRWSGGLVAASVAVVAVGIGMTVVRGGGSDVGVVAQDAAGASAPALAEALAGGPQGMNFAGMVPPVQMLVDSDTPYTRSGLSAQVESVMKRFGLGPSLKSQAAVAAAPMPMADELPATGFTSDEQRLRDCVTKLTSLAQSTALMVDRSTYESQNAGVVVTPDYAPGSATTSPTGHWQVFVVDPNCELKLTIEISLTP